MTVKKINDLEALSTLTKSTNYAIPILDLNDRDADGDPKLKQVPINLLQSLFKNETKLATVATSGKYGDLKHLPQLFSGNYADLSGKPSIPSRTSDLQNDSGFLTQHQDISGKADVTLIRHEIIEYYQRYPVEFKTPGSDIQWDVSSFWDDFWNLNQNLETRFFGTISSSWGTHYLMGVKAPGSNSYAGESIYPGLWFCRESHGSDPQSYMIRFLLISKYGQNQPSKCHYLNESYRWSESETSDGYLTIDGFFLRERPAQ